MPGRRTLGKLCSVSVGQVGAANDRWHRALRAIDPNQFVADAGELGGIICRQSSNLRPFGPTSLLARKLNANVVKDGAADLYLEVGVVADLSRGRPQAILARNFG